MCLTLRIKLSRSLIVHDRCCSLPSLVAPYCFGTEDAETATATAFSACNHSRQFQSSGTPAPAPRPYYSDVGGDKCDAHYQLRYSSSFACAVDRILAHWLCCSSILRSKHRSRSFWIWQTPLLTDHDPEGDARECTAFSLAR